MNGPADEGFDLHRTAASLPIFRQKTDLALYVEMAQQIPTYWRTEPKLQIVQVEAGPANRSLKIFNGKIRQIT
jgi:hypothetical protein